MRYSFLGFKVSFAHLLKQKTRAKVQRTLTLVFEGLTTQGISVGTAQFPQLTQQSDHCGEFPSGVYRQLT